MVLRLPRACYFGKPAPQLTLPEAAFLAGLPKAPELFAQYGQSSGALALCAGAHAGAGLYHAPRSGKQRRKTRRLSFRRRPIPARFYNAPYFAEYVRRDIEQRYGADMLYKGGLKIETTADLRLQQAAEGAVLRGIEAYDKRAGKKNAPSNSSVGPAVHGPLYRAMSRPLSAGAIFTQTSSTGLCRRSASRARPSSPSFMPRLWTRAIRRQPYLSTRRWFLRLPARVFSGSPRIMTRHSPAP